MRNVNKLNMADTLKAYEALKKLRPKVHGQENLESIKKLLKEETGLTPSDSTLRRLCKELKIIPTLARKPSSNSKIKTLLVELCTELCGEDHDLTRMAKEL